MTIVCFIYRTDVDCRLRSAGFTCKILPCYTLSSRSLSLLFSLSFNIYFSTLDQQTNIANIGKKEWKKMARLVDDDLVLFFYCRERVHFLMNYLWIFLFICIIIFFLLYFNKNKIFIFFVQMLALRAVCSETSVDDDQWCGQAAFSRSPLRPRVRRCRFTSRRQHSLVHSRSSAGGQGSRE